MTRQNAGAVAGLAALCLLLRVPTLELPLDRDLAAYATIGQNLLEGAVPYRDLFDHKQPLVYPVYALLELVAPRSSVAVRLTAAALAAVVATLVLAGFAGRLGRGRALAAAAFTALLAATNWAQGAGLNTEHLMVAVQVLAVAVALRFGVSGRRRVPLAVGILLGFAILAKGTGAFVAPALAVALLGQRRDRPVRTLALLAGGAAIPLCLVAGLYAGLGALGDFWYANFTYNRLYLSQPFGADRPLGGLRLGLKHAWPIIGSALAALAALGWWLLRARRWDTSAVVLAVWTGGALASAMLSGRGFGHYFAPVVPAAALALVYALGRGKVPTALAGIALAVAGTASAIDLAGRAGQPRESLAAELYGASGAVWLEAEALGPRIRARARPGDRMHAQGTDPNIYWTSGVRPASRFYYNLVLTIDRDRWERRTRADLCATPPRFYVTSPLMLPLDVPRCMEEADYVAFAREGSTTVHELRTSP